MIGPSAPDLPCTPPLRILLVDDHCILREGLCALLNREPGLVVTGQAGDGDGAIKTVLGMDIAALLGGVLFVENVFALPGIGTLAVQSVFNLDVPMIMGTVLFSAVLVVGANLVVDVLYRWIDPRIKQGA